MTWDALLSKRVARLDIQPQTGNTDVDNLDQVRFELAFCE